MQDNMPRGEQYSYEYQRKKDRDGVLRRTAERHAKFKQLYERVKRGELRMIKTPIINGYTIRFEEVQPTKDTQ
jgi:hypothetical protein